MKNSTQLLAEAVRVAYETGYSPMQVTKQRDTLINEVLAQTCFIDQQIKNISQGIPVTIYSLNSIREGLEQAIKNVQS